MADAAISMLVEPLISGIGQWLKEEISLVKGVKDELENVSSKLQTIQDVLDDAEKRSITEDPVRGWLQKLKEISYEMDDVLDEWRTSVSKLTIDEEASHKPSGVPVEKISWSSLSTCFSSKQHCCLPLKQVGLRCHIAKKIKDINVRLDSITKQMGIFSFHRNPPLSNKSNIPLESERMMTTSIVDVSEVYGRDSDKRTLLDILSDEGTLERNRIHIIFIMGGGGIGKTTLAKFIYNDSEVGKRFDEKIWVCVSEHFDDSRIAREIVEAIQKSPSNFDSKNKLFEHLQKLVCGKRLLLVLDDVWEEDGKKWEDLRNCLKGGSPESRVLVTTRKEMVGEVMGATHVHNLGCLSESACRTLFHQIAFDGKKDFESLRDIGEQIVKKCKGFPLAVRALGSLLHSKKTVEEWQKVLESEIWQLEGLDVYLFPHLFLSYNELSSYVKRCFLYCSIFPKDRTLYVNDLIEEWMAQGYIPVSDREHEMEQKGREIFDKLAFSSFFQDFEKDKYTGHIISCKMHDIVHDFARYLTKDECIIIEEGKPGSASRKTRHLYTATESPLGVCDVGKLRTFFVDEFVLNKHVNLLKSLKCARVLKLIACDLETLPKEIGNLVHLRYLSLYGNRELKELPESVCELHNLQTLNIRYCRITVFPEMIGKLINLRHLYVGNYSFPECPASFVKLSNLRRLKVFMVGRKYCKLEYLKHFMHLRGKLNIKFSSKLEEEDVIADAQKADLKNKKYINKLRLDFEENREIATEAVLEALQPPPDIVQLKLHFIFGIQYPSWLVKSLDNLRSLFISNCPNWSTLPPLWELPNLEKLYFYKMRSVKRIGNEFLGIKDVILQGNSSGRAFPKLLQLSFENFEEWEKWEDLDEEFENTSRMIMPQLQELRIDNCPKLNELPVRLLQKMPLRSLFISNCPNWSTLPPLWELPNLEKLNFCNMRSVKRIGNEFLGIKDTVPQGDSSGLAFPKLLELSFQNFGEWGKWEDLDEEFENTGMMIMPQLQELRINNCPILNELPIRLLQRISLQALEISGCHGLHEETGADGSHGLKQRLHHIPRIDIIEGYSFSDENPNACNIM